LWVNLGTPASTKKKPKKKNTAVNQDSDSPDAQMNAEEENLETGRISLYEDIKQKLIAQGIPENEIAFIHDHDSPERKRALFQKANDGKVRILISTIKKLATGANIQTRLSGMHFFDPPWKPADIEQAVGRAIRRGNLYKDWGGVQAFTYVTKGSFDAYIWQLLENKAKAIKQIMRGEIDSVEDTGRIELNADEVKALASSNPKVLELVKVRNEAGQLRAEYYGYRQEQGNIQSEIANKTHSVERNQRAIEKAEAELKTMPSRDDLHSDFKVTIGKKEYSKRSEIGAALVKAMPVIDSKDEAKKAEQIKDLVDNPVKIGSAYGNPLYAGRSDYDGSAKIIIADRKYGDSHAKYEFKLSDDDAGNGVKLFNYFDKKYDEPGRVKARIAQDRLELAALQDRAGVEWPKSARMKASEDSLRRLESELGSAAGQKGALPVVSELTKFAIMAEKLGQQEGRAVTFDGTQWMYGDRTPVPHKSVTKEMELEVDREVQLLLVDSDETPQKLFFFHKTAEETAKEDAAGRDAFFIQNQKKKNAGYYRDFRNQWNRFKSTPGLGAAITPELLRAAGNVVVGEIRLGAKRFSVLIEKLRREFDDTIVNHLKPTLIVMWNANQEKYGLDDASPELFDEAMSDTVDVDVEKTIEAATEAVAPTEPPAAQEPAPAEPAAKPDSVPEPAYDDDDVPVIGINKAKRAERLDELGLEQEDIVNKIGHSFPELDAEAKRVSPGEAEDVFTKIGEGEEAAENASDRDMFVMLNHIAHKQNATNKTQEDLEAAQIAGDDNKVVELEAKLSIQVKEEARLMAIAKNAGTAAGRALAALKALLKHDMSLARFRMRLHAAADGNPTAAQTKALNALHAKYEAAVKDLEAKTKEVEEVTTRAEIAEAIAREMEAKSKPEPKGKTKADRRLDAALNALGKDLSFFSIEATLKKLPQLVELAGALIEKNMENFNDFVAWTSKRWGKTPKPETLPVLQQAWDTAWDLAKNPQPSAPPEVSFEPDHPESLIKSAKALFRHFLSEGITDTDAVIDAVHAELQDQFPEYVGERLDTMKAMVDYDKMRTVSKDPLDMLAAAKRAVVQMKIHLRRMRDGLAPKRLEQRNPVTDEERQHRKMVADEKRKGGFDVTDPERQATSTLASMETRLRHTMSDLLNEIATKKLDVADKTAGQTSDTLEDLKAYLTLVRGWHKAVFGNKKMTQEQRLKAAEASAVKNEAYWNDRLARAADGDTSTGKTKPDPVTNANIDAIKARTEFAKAQVQFLHALANPKPDPVVLSDLRYIASLENQRAVKLARIADITARAAAGDFAPERNLSKEKREANAQRRKSNASIRDARIALDGTSRDLHEHIEAVAKSNLTYVDLAKRVPGGVFSLIRDMAFGGELSFILKQGAPHVFGTLVPAGKIARAGYEAITGNPAAAKVKLRQARQGYGKLGSALAGSLRAMLLKTDTELARSQDKIKQRPNYISGMYNSMGVPVEETGGKLTVKEEVFLNNLVETGGLALDKMFPGFKGFRDGSPRFTGTAHNLNVANRFSNATKLFMSTIRADIADNAAEVWTLKRGEMTPAEARSLGRVTNMVTGKGDMEVWGLDGEKTHKFLNSILISASWLKSRLEMVFEPVLSLKPQSGRTAESRKIAAEIYVDLAAGVAAYYGLVVLSAMFYNDDDDEKPVVEWDSTSSDFMKPRFGKTRLDPLFGLQQVIVLGSRMYHGTYKDSRGNIKKRDGNSDLMGLVGQFLKGRLHPAIQAGVSIYTQEDFSGQPTTTKEVLMRMPIPVTYPDIVDASKNRGIPASTAFGMWGFAGGGLQTTNHASKNVRTCPRNSVSFSVKSQTRKPQPSSANHCGLTLTTCSKHIW
jgi:uncharacterized protein YifE (UPF0438 family)